MNKPTQIKNISNYDPNTGLILLLNIDNYFINELQFKVKLFIQNYSTIFRRDHAYTYESGIYIPSGITFISFERVSLSKSRIKLNFYFVEGFG